MEGLFARIEALPGFKRAWHRLVSLFHLLLQTINPRPSTLNWRASGTDQLPTLNSQPSTAPPAAVPPAMQNPPAKAVNPPEKITKPSAAAETTPAVDGVAVLALGVAGEIFAAGDATVAIFGWAPGALVGQNVRILLKGGLDNEVGRFLLRHHAGQNPTGTTDLRVLALRKDGSEFAAQVTAQTCNWDTTTTKKGDTSRPYCTAAFRELREEAQPVVSAATEIKLAGEVASDKPEKAQRKDSAAPPPVSPLAERPQGGQVPSQARILALPVVAGRPAAEPVAALELKQRIAELEDQLNKATAELAGAKGETQKQGCQMAELQAQLDAAKESAGYLEAALREETGRREKLDERLRNLSNGLSQEQAERSQRFEEQLLGLRKERDELDRLLAAERLGTDESTRRAAELEALLTNNTAALEHVKAELEKQAAERQQSESSWREQLDTAWTARRELEGAWAGAVERNVRFEEELASLRREHDELSRKLATEQKAAADSKERAKELESRLSCNAVNSDRARSELEKQIAKREEADAEWRKQLEAARTLQAKLESSLTEATERSRRLEEEQAAWRKERDELQTRVKAEQQTAVEAGRRADELQRRVDQNTAEVERLAADLKKQNTARERVEARAGEQQETAQTLARKLEAERAESVERNARFKEELAELRAERDELSVQLKAERQASTDAAHQVDELQRRLDRITTEFNRVKAEAERKRSTRANADLEWSEQPEPAKVPARKVDAAWREATERIQPELDESTASGPNQLPEYSFGSSSSMPARRKRPLSRQRL